MDPLKYEWRSKRAVSIIIVTCVFCSFAIFASILRLWSRRLKKTSLQFNDYAILVALFWQISLTALVIASAILGGIGLHVDKVPPKQFTLMSQLDIVCVQCWALANTFTKFSILHLYITMFPKKYFRWACFFLIGITACSWAIIFLEFWLLCIPFSGNWTGQGHCANTRDAYLAAAIQNFLIDTMIVVAPIQPLWNLQMALAKKLQLISIFSIGGFILIVSILRLTSTAALDDGDFSYTLGLEAVYSCLEPGLGIVSACLPVMQPVLDKYRIFRWSKPNSKSQGRNTNTLEDASFQRSKQDEIAKGFRRLREDPIGLTSLSGMDTLCSNDIGPASDSGSQEGDFPFRSNEIHVKHGWVVQSSGRRDQG